MKTGTPEKGLENWACEGEWQEAENSAFSGYDERCHFCATAQEHSFNAHYRAVNIFRLADDINRLIPWSRISITPDLKAIIGVGRKGIFIREWPYGGLAFGNEGIIILE